MANTAIKRSPLEGLVGSTAGTVKLEERAYTGKVTLRGNPDDASFMKAVEDVIGVALPTKALSFAEGKTYTACWMGPDEWLLLTPEDGQNALVAALNGALESFHKSVVDVTDYYVIMRLSGQNAREIITNSCPLDVHPSKFSAGMCTNTKYARASIFLMQMDDTPTYDVMVRWSMADYLWNYFVDGSREFA